MTSFDRWQLRRTLAYGALAAIVCFCIVVLTDEATSTARMRVARIAAFMPALAVIAVLATCARLRGRGEDTALEALGVAPWRLALGAVLGGWAMGMLGLVLLATPWADGRALFPIIPKAIVFEPWREGFRSLESGIIVDATGGIQRFESTVDVGVRSDGFASALWVVAPLAAVAPLWAVVPLRPLFRWGGFTVTALLAVIALHGVAAGRLASPLSAFAVVPLVAQAFVGVRRAARLMGRQEANARG